MINSMTGYGRCCETVGGREIAIDIKCVNHRYYEPSFRVARAYSYLEETAKAYISKKVERGKLELSISINDFAGDTKIGYNREIAKSYYDSLKSLSEELSLDFRPDVYAIARMPEVFSLSKQEVDESEIWGQVQPVLDGALSMFFEMRKNEGKKLAEDVEYRLNEIEKLVTFIESRSAAFRQRYFERIHQQMTELLGTVNIDQSRILMEAAIFADKAAVDEETVRLRSHIDQMRGFLTAKEPVGKKMDFLIQEFNREANTIGSKANDIDVTKSVVELKAQIEKIREQIQNIE